MEISVYISGSDGNMSRIKGNNTTFFIDCGFKSQRDMHTKLKQTDNVTTSDIKYLFITHAHPDHVNSLKPILASNSLVRIFTTKEILDDILYKEKIEFSKIANRVEYIEAGKTYSLLDLTYDVVEVSHDIGCIGFVFHIDNRKIAYITDCGVFPKVDYKLIEDSDVYMLEANYNPYLLSCSPYSEALKRRIMSPTGHLSNLEAVSIINKVVKKKCIWIALHISENSNSEEMIETDVVNNIERPDLVELVLTSHTNPVKVSL